MPISKKSVDESDVSCVLDKESGTIYIAGDINLRMASKFRRLFRKLEPSGHSGIVIEINSPGGDVEAGFLMIDTIRLSKVPVTTRVTGVAMSMAALILAAGGYREALPNSSIMVHQISSSLRARVEDFDVEVQELHRWEASYWKFLDMRTGKTDAYWKQKCTGKNLYLNPEEALAENLIHRICE